MTKKINWKLILLLSLLIMLSSCSLYRPNGKINYTKNDGTFSKSKSDTITVKYTIKTNSGFFASLDFELTDGEVDWDIVNPKMESVYKGYVIYENGKVLRQLTFPTSYSSGELNIKEEVKSETGVNEKIIHVPDFRYLGFDYGSISGSYTLHLKPVNAKGSYHMEWSDSLLLK